MLCCSPLQVPPPYRWGGLLPRAAPLCATRALVLSLARWRGYVQPRGSLRAAPTPSTPGLWRAFSDRHLVWRGAHVVVAAFQHGVLAAVGAGALGPVSLRLTS